MAQRCVHKGCEKLFTDPEEECHYHPGAPIFHEGKQGWKCCKTRVLSFDDFLNIPPCTTGLHSTTDKPPEIEKVPRETDEVLAKRVETLNYGSSDPPGHSAHAALTQAPATPPPPQPDTDDDDPSLEIPNGTECRRKGCSAKYHKGAPRDGEKCVFHPGAPIFHEGSKGYWCCKRRVLEFDEFLKIEGCKTKDRHLFIGSGRKAKEAEAKVAGGEEILPKVRHDFYQTSTTVHASFYLKKVVKDTAKVEIHPTRLVLDIKTSDPLPKRYTTEMPLYSTIDPEKSNWSVSGVKLQLALAKTENKPWPTLESEKASSG